MTGDHARESTSVPRRSRRDDGARPIPPNRAPTPVRASQFWVLGFCRVNQTRDAPSWPSWRHLWAPWSRASDRGRSRDARRRVALRTEWPGTSGRRFSQLDANRGIVPPGPQLELREIRLKMNSAAPCQVGFFEGASFRPRAMATLVSCAAMAPRVAAATHRRVSRVIASQRRSRRWSPTTSTWRRRNSRPQRRVTALL